jgi:hypothetical protein
MADAPHDATFDHFAIVLMPEAQATLPKAVQEANP